MVIFDARISILNIIMKVDSNSKDFNMWDYSHVTLILLNLKLIVAIDNLRDISNRAYYSLLCSNFNDFP